MKSVIVSVALAALFAPSASFGDTAAAIGGSVIDAATGRPLAGIAIEVTGQDGRNSRTAETDKHGFFMLLGVDPDRYVTTARAPGGGTSCRIEDVASGQMRRMRIAVGAKAETTCTVGRSVGTLVDPDETTDVYRIR